MQNGARTFADAPWSPHCAFYAGIAMTFFINDFLYQ
jgi:hypothetical protein